MFKLSTLSLSRLFALLLIHFVGVTIFFSPPAQAGASDEAIKVVGRGLESSETHEVLLLQCVGEKSVETGEATCGKLQLIVVRSSGETVPIGDPLESQPEFAWYQISNYIGEIERAENIVKKKDRQNAFIAMSRSNKLSRAEWKQVGSLIARDRENWQFQAELVDHRFFRHFVIALSGNDEVLTPARGACSFQLIEDFDFKRRQSQGWDRLIEKPPGEAVHEMVTMYLPWFNREPKVTPREKGPDGVRILGEGDHLMFRTLFRRYYDYRPSEDKAFRIIFKRNWEFQWSRRSSQPLCTSISFVDSKTQTPFFTRQYCQSSFRNDWKEFLREMPNCEKIRSIVQQGNP